MSPGKIFNVIMCLNRIFYCFLAIFQAIGSMIEHIIEDYAQIMIVKFDENAARVYPVNSNIPVELDSKERRLEVANSLQNITTGDFTCSGKACCK